MIAKKSNDRSNPKNWRPISITSCLMRLFEKVILKRLNSFLRENNILIRNQSGFRAKRSTLDNLFFVSQKAFECYNRGWSMLSIFFDIEAAFDKVWHDGLIFKLCKIKIPYYILRFLINFLRGRKFQVKVGDSLSFEGNIECGVPQGGVVSPTLFSVKINDAPQRNKRNREMTLLFADDKNYNLIFKKLNKSILKKAQTYVNELAAWARMWRLTLAPHKSNLMVFSRSNDFSTININLDGVQIPRCKSVKFLGITLDERMNLKDHINNVRTDCRTRLNALKIVSHKSWHLSKKVLKQIYHATIRSKIEYCSFVFDCIGQTQKTRMNTIQNNALRAVYRKKRQFGNENLHAIAGEITLEERLIESKQRFINKSIEFQNPVIVPLISDYNSYKGGRNIIIKTPLCAAIPINSTSETEPADDDEDGGMYSSYVAHPQQHDDMYSSYNGSLM